LTSLLLNDLDGVKSALDYCYVKD